MAAFECPEGRGQAFLWDTEVPGLGLRVTANAARAYIFQARFQGTTPRITIGNPSSWTIPMAREKARELQRDIDGGRDRASP